MNSNSAGYSAALYMRLSKDDDGVLESSSITTQRKMLYSYAEENSFPVYGEYVDDGFSGTNFSRPAFQRMLADIESKKVNLVLTKDLSRLGRDYIATGQFTEIYFPSKGVRYIAVNDGYDSESPCTDIAPFKNVINELYARDTSKKIRSAFRAKMEDGCYIGNFAPYGYRKDPENKNHLLVDETAASVVREIFKLASEGKTPIQIARHLNTRGVLSPALYRCRNHPELQIDNYSKRKEWTSATVSKMLHNIVYLGHLAQGKTAKVSFKSHVTIQKQKEDWISVKNTHEAIVKEELFDLVQRRCKSRTCQKEGSFFNIFSGIAKCSECGRNMSAVGTRKKGSPANLVCGGYKQYGNSECTNHFIDYNVLYQIVLEAIREQARLSEQEKKELLEELKSETEPVLEKSEKKKEQNRLNKRIRELDAIIEKLYEDHFQGVVSEERFQKILGKYEAESKNITEQRNILTKALEKEENEKLSEKQSNEKYLELIKDYTDMKVLTQDILFDWIERIEIQQGYYDKATFGRKVKHQTVKIYFRFSGGGQTKLWLN